MENISNIETIHILTDGYYDIKLSKVAALVSTQMKWQNQLIRFTKNVTCFNNSKFQGASLPPTKLFFPNKIKIYSQKFQSITCLAVYCYSLVTYFAWQTARSGDTKETILIYCWPININYCFPMPHSSFPFTSCRDASSLPT